MRITRDTLMKVAQEHVAQRVRSDRGLLAAYLSGSMNEEEFLIGGTADIDIFLVHSDAVGATREIVPLTEDIHLDIAHHFQRDYRQTRQLRVHPWLGPTVKNYKILYDPQHFLDFTQASVRGQYDRSDHVMERVRGQFQTARQIWTSLQFRQAANPPDDLLSYLKALSNAVNSVAGLSGAPLTERRFLTRFEARAKAVNRPGLYPGLLGLLGAPQVDVQTLKSWLPSVETAYIAIPEASRPPRLHPARSHYYLRSFEAFLGGDQPLVILWPLLRTWTLASSLLPGNSIHRASWEAAVTHLGLMGDAFLMRLAGLDAYLDQVDETLEEWGRRSGAEIA
jgi:hypothetical protein